MLVYFSPPAVLGDPEGGGGNTGKLDWYYYVGGFVHSSNGNLVVQEADFAIAGLGYTMALVRTYNAQLAATDGPLGYGWTSNWHTHLTENVDDSVTWTDPTGASFTFVIDDGDYVSPAGISAKLVHDDTNGVFRLYHKDGSVWGFGTNNYLDYQATRDGPAIWFNWSGDTPPKLLNVTADSGLLVELSYTGAGITTVTYPPSDRTVEFAYTDGELVTVTDAMGNDTDFTYGSGHLLDTWTDPVGKRYSFDYDVNDRVTFVNLSAINVGTGATLYGFSAYEFAYDGVWTNVTNAREDVTSIQHNAAGNPLLVDGPQCGECGAFQLVGKGPGGCGCSGGGSCGGAGFREVSESVSMTWDTDHNLLTYADAAGNDWQLDWDERNNPLNLTDPLDSVMRWNWTNVDDVGSGGTYISLLDNRTDYRGYKWEFTYTSTGNLENTTDPLGNVSVRAYDANGSLVSYTDFRGNETTYEYNGHGQRTKTTDARGNDTLYGRDEVGRVLNITTPRGNLWTYAYDALNRLVNVTDALGNSTLFEYNARGDRTSVEDALGRHTNTSFNVTNGKVHNMTDAYGNVTSYSYDLVGNLVTATDRGDDQTSYAYDDWNRLTTVTDPSDNQTTYTYNSDGTVDTRTDRRGFNTTYGWDAKHQLLNVTDALGNLTEYLYDKDGRQTSMTDANGEAWTFTYDALGRLAQVIDPLNNATSLSYDENGNLLLRLDPNSHATSQAYDELNRRVTETDAESHTTTYAYDEDSNLISVLDAAGNYTNHSYDELGHLSQTTNGLGETVNYTYDDVGNLVNVTDGRGHSTLWTYDALNRRVIEQSHLGNQTTWKYTSEGRVATKQDANGEWTNYTYDVMERLVDVTYTAGSPDAHYVFTYDEEGNRLTAADDFFRRTDTYDALDRITSVNFDYFTFNKTVKYAYDAVGNRVGLMYPDKVWLNSSYDELNRLSSMQLGTNSSYAFEFDAGSRVTRVTYPTGMTTEYMYNSANWLMSVFTNDSGGGVLESFEYTRDDIGNVLTMTDTQPIEDARVSTYTYDNAYRLAGEQNGDGDEDWINYTYDASGNRLDETVGIGSPIGYGYDEENKLLFRGSTTFAYDANGNLVNRTTLLPGQNWTYAWDGENRLVQVTSPDSLTTRSYEYSTDGNRVSAQTDTDPRTYFLYDFRDSSGFDDILGEYNDVGVLQVRYVHGPGPDRPLQRIVDSTNTSYYYAADGLGSVSRLVDSNEITDSVYRYEAFGALRDHTNGTTNPYHFTGRELDATFGLYYYRARTYDTDIGRFLSRDPARTADGPNPYIYVQGNPTNLVDPSGLIKAMPIPVGSSPQKTLNTVHLSLESGPSPVPDVYWDAEDIAFEWWETLFPNTVCAKAAGDKSKQAVRNYGLATDEYPRHDLISHCIFGCYLKKYCKVSDASVFVIAALKETSDLLTHGLDASHYQFDDYDATTYGAQQCADSWVYVYSWVNDDTPERMQETCGQCCIRAFYVSAKTGAWTDVPNDEGNWYRDLYS